MVDLVLPTFRPQHAPLSLDIVQANDKTDTPFKFAHDDTATKATTHFVLEALARLQLEKNGNSRLQPNNEGGNYNLGLKAADGECVEGLGVGEPALSNNHSYEIDGNYLDLTKDDSDYAGVVGKFSDYDYDYKDTEMSFTSISFAEHYHGYDPRNDDFSDSDSYSSESGSQDYPKREDTQQQGSRKCSLFSQYKRILPPNVFSGYPPTQFPIEPIYRTPGPFNIPPGIYAFVKKIAVECEIVMVRSMTRQVNGYGLKAGQLCCMKIYSRYYDSAQRRRRMNDQLRTEVKVYQRLAEAARKDKPGFLFLMQLDASLQDESRYFLIMPLMKTDLRTVLQNNGLPRVSFARVMENRRLLAQIAVGIATLHSIGIIHRDIKPENILIDFYGNIQIADFGVSMVRDRCEPCVNGRKYSWESVGTWPYAAPEVVISRNPLYGLEVDYWALGYIAFEMEAWGHQDLFASAGEYNYWCSVGARTIAKRLEFMAFAILSDYAFLLVCGLLNPDPGERYGILALMKHPYFMVNGVSEFYRLDERAASRQREPFIPPVTPRPSIKYSPKPADNTPHGWFNPRGAFFPH